MYISHNIEVHSHLYILSLYCPNFINSSTYQFWKEIQLQLIHSLFTVLLS